MQWSSKQYSKGHFVFFESPNGHCVISMKTLKEIDLGLNEIGNHGAECLAKVLGHMTVIRFLLSHLPHRKEFAFVLQALETINLERNNIEDDGAQSLAMALAKNTVINIQICLIIYTFIIFATII